jgi:hypothetical protein
MEFESNPPMMTPSNLIKLLINEPDKRTPWLTKTTGHVCLACGILIMVSLTGFLANYLTYSSNMARLTNLTAQYKAFDASQNLIKHYDDNAKQNPQALAQFHKKQVDHTLTLEDLKAGISKLQRTLKIQSLSTHYGMPQKRQDMPQLSSLSVTIELKTLHDKQLFTFIDKMQRELPGLVQLGEFSIKRTSPLTPTALAAAPQGKLSLFDATLNFTWCFLEGRKS